MAASAEVARLREAMRLLPRRELAVAEAMGGERVAVTRAAWPGDDGRCGVRMVVGPGVDAARAGAELMALAGQVRRAVLVSFERTPFCGVGGARRVPGIAPSDARAVIGSALPLPAAVTLFDFPLPGGGRQAVLAREVPAMRDWRVAYRMREVEFAGDHVVPIPFEVELDVAGPTPPDGDPMPSLVRRVVDPLGAAASLQRLLPDGERMSPYARAEALTSYATLLMHLLVTMDSPGACVTDVGDGLLVRAWDEVHGP